MIIHIRAVGKLKSEGEGQLVQRYHTRALQLARHSPISNIDIKQVLPSRARDEGVRMIEEARELRKGLPAQAMTIALDERGTPLTSQDFANLLARFRDDGCRDLVFFIGAADGLHPEILQGAQQVLSFGKQTWPHQLVRCMLLEQIYRSLTLWQNHPYHRT